MLLASARRWNDASPAGRSGLRGSEGLAYQASAVAQHIAEGLTESPLHPLDRTIAVLETIDEARRQVGV